MSNLKQAIYQLVLGLLLTVVVMTFSSTFDGWLERSFVPSALAGDDQEIIDGG